MLRLRAEPDCDDIDINFHKLNSKKLWLLHLFPSKSRVLLRERS